jgi:soluble lytic murein transglycosylase-like protein
MLRDRTHINARATWKHVAIAVLWLASTSVHAQDSALNDVEPTLATGGHNADLGAGETPTSRAAIRKIIERETARTNLPADITEAVVFVEGGYNPGTIGTVGEIGLMQVRPETAAMLGFRGHNAELAKPDINIH